MRTKEKHTGICLLCKLHKELTFEHIPPKVAFNKNTRYYVIPHEEYYTIKNIFEDKKKGIIHQGGMGNYCLCTKCNSFLGKSYVRSYETWANIGMHVNHSFDFDFILLRIKDLNPLSGKNGASPPGKRDRFPVFRNGTPKITFDLANVRPYRRDLSAGCPF